MSQRDDRMYSGRNTGSRSVTEEGDWCMAPPRNRGTRQPYVVDSAKLKMMNVSIVCNLKENLFIIIISI